MKRLSDDELMHLVKTGDFSAFDELYNRYRHPLRRFLFSLTWDQDASEDYLQEVFVRLFQSRERYTPAGRFSAYLFRIAKNYYLTQRRRKSRKELPWTDQRNGFRPFEDIIANERIEPEIHLMEEYRRWRIRRAIDCLPAAQKLVFVMSHFEGMKYAEIAAILGIPVGTVKSRMSVAVSKLRSFLKEDEK